MKCLYFSLHLNLVSHFKSIIQCIILSIGLSAKYLKMNNKENYPCNASRYKWSNECRNFQKHLKHFITK